MKNKYNDIKKVFRRTIKCYTVKITKIRHNGDDSSVYSNIIESITIWLVEIRNEAAFNACNIPLNICEMKQ